MGRGLRRKIGKRFLFILVVLIVVFGGAEIVLRLSGLSINSADASHSDGLLFHDVDRGEQRWDEYITLGVRVYPLGTKTYNIERPLTPKPEGVTRVICLGDSSTIGAEVQPDQPYPQILQRILPQCYPQKNVEVWNFGKHGYTSYQGRLLVEQVWDAAQPDVLVFYFGANDMSPAPIRADKDWRNMPRWSLQLHRWFYLHSALYRMLRNINLNYLRRKVTLAFEENPEPETTRMRVSKKDFFANREALKKRVENGGGRLLTVISAGLTHNEVVPAPCYLDYKQKPDDIDEVALFAPAHQTGQNPFADFVHPSPHGHRLLARAITEKLAERWGPPQCDLEALFAAEAQR